MSACWCPTTSSKAPEPMPKSASRCGAAADRSWHDLAVAQFPQPAEAGFFRIDKAVEAVTPRLGHRRDRVEAEAQGEIEIGPVAEFGETGRPQPVTAHDVVPHRRLVGHPLGQ